MNKEELDKAKDAGQSETEAMRDLATQHKAAKGGKKVALKDIKKGKGGGKGDKKVGDREERMKAEIKADEKAAKKEAKALKEQGRGKMVQSHIGS